MKKLTFTLIIVMGVINGLVAQNSEIRSLATFDKIKLDGNARLYLIKSDTPSIKLETRKNVYLGNYVTEVRNGTLYLHFERRHRRNNDRKVDIYLSYTTLNNIDVDGFIRLESYQALTMDQLVIKGDGFIKGDIIVDVNDLSIDLDGFCGLTVSGKANSVDLKIDGFGKINAKHLETTRAHTDADGFSKIRI
ncbi:MAG: hypothetical protein COA50_10465 [Flavobacteriaceae bacterium]|nr:MAG: hypothetical protein COA50_10465 [Flavobacteriaceae bacterium]